MPASASHLSDPPRNGPEPARCQNCSMAFRIPDNVRSAGITALVEAESARCARLIDITRQRRALGARIQAGIAGMLGSETLETSDLVANRKTVAQLEAALKAEADDLAKVMMHVPAEAMVHP